MAGLIQYSIIFYEIKFVKGSDILGKIMEKENVKTVMLEHSKAKVDLYSTYLSMYLNILSQLPYLNKIHIYDLMCGEGIYSDGSKGSPIITMEKIKDNYFKNKEKCPKIEVWFNDRDKSKIEKNKHKIDRVREYCDKFKHLDIVNAIYTKCDYTTLYPKIVKKIHNFKNEKLLLFIDPYGYKEIQPEHLKFFLTGGKTEIILFLPISHMYRFADKSLSGEEFHGGIPLKEFLTPLLNSNNDLRNSKSSEDFIDNLKIAFREYFKKQGIFVDTFTIKRDDRNMFCLFFFTSNALGFEKMLEAKWKLDEQRGKGFRFDSQQGSLFSEVETTDYTSKLENYIKSNVSRTNSEIYLYGLNEGFLPKHTNQIFRDWQKNKSTFKVYLLDGSEARKNSFYILYKNYVRNPEKIVNFKFV